MKLVICFSGVVDQCFCYVMLIWVSHASFILYSLLCSVSFVMLGTFHLLICFFCYCVYVCALTLLQVILIYVGGRPTIVSLSLSVVIFKKIACLEGLVKIYTLFFAVLDIMVTLKHGKVVST